MQQGETRRAMEQIHAGAAAALLRLEQRRPAARPTARARPGIVESQGARMVDPELRISAACALLLSSSVNAREPLSTRAPRARGTA